MATKASLIVRNKDEINVFQLLESLAQTFYEVLHILKTGRKSIFHKEKELKPKDVSACSS
jgi:hypothetical protein